MNFIQVLLLLFVIVIGKDLERWDREAPLLFVVFIFGGAGIFTAFGSQPYSCTQSTMCVELLRGGSDRSKESYITLVVDGKKRKFDLSFHRRLEKYFPDWDTRITYQQERQQFYDSAMQKRHEALKLKMKDNWNRTDQEQDAIDYFSGRNFYKKHQSLNQNPNIFDSRQSFLFKMHNKEMRNNFLKSYNRYQNN